MLLGIKRRMQQIDDFSGSCLLPKGAYCALVDVMAAGLGRAIGLGGSCLAKKGFPRAYALQKHRPLTLHATIGPPTVDPDPSSSINGFVHLVNLYRPFDDTFIGLWNKSRNDCSTYWLAQLQEQLTQALPPYLDTTESQAADLRTSQQWLRTMVWQLSISNNFLSSSSPDSSMTFHFPIEVAKDLVAVTSHFSKQAMEVHGIGLVRVTRQRVG